jgi:antitoxin (DNA-binding transcriptional repressor) of toxin-antitoxin stability system
MIRLYNPGMPKHVIHISEAEAASDFAGVLARVRAGAEIVIEGQEPIVVVVRPSKPEPGRLLSESIALAEAHGSTVTLDGGLARDLEDIVNSHGEALNPPTWD